MVNASNTSVDSDPRFASLLDRDPGVARRLKRVVAVAVAVHAVLFFIRFSTVHPVIPPPEKPPMPPIVDVPHINPPLEVAVFEEPVQETPVIVPEADEEEYVPVDHNRTDWMPTERPQLLRCHMEVTAGHGG